MQANCLAKIVRLCWLGYKKYLDGTLILFKCFCLCTFLNLLTLTSWRWKRLFKKSFDKFILDPSYYNSVFPTQWKELFILRSNWFSGHCHVQSLHRKSATSYLKEPTRVVCLKISNCGRSLLASVNFDSSLVHLWSLIDKRSINIISCESIVGCIDFGSERSRNFLIIGLHNNTVSQ